MPGKTSSQIGKANVAKAKRDERAVAEYLREVGPYPNAERAVRTGFRSTVRTGADPGDITGVPGTVISVKSWEDPLRVERSITELLDELDAMAAGDLTVDPVRLLVVRRYGKPDPADWWCFMRARTLLTLSAPGAHPADLHFPVRLTFCDAVHMMRAGRAVIAA